MSDEKQELPSPKSKSSCVMSGQWNVKNNQRDVIRKQVNEFRLREIVKARSKLLAEISELDAEHDKLVQEIETAVFNGG